MFKSTIPKRLQHLKTDERGYPIPFFIAYIDGKADFRLADERKQLLCIKEDLCWICGKKLLKHVYFFITGPLGLKNKTVTDCGMHRECAEFSLQACPHMFYENAERREKGAVYEDALTKTKSYLQPKPEELYLIFSDKQESFPVNTTPEHIVHMIKFRPQRIEKFVYQNGILVKEGTLK